MKEFLTELRDLYSRYPEASAQYESDYDAMRALADQLAQELAEARKLLREARDAMGGKLELDGMREQIDAFLAADQPSDGVKP